MAGGLTLATSPRAAAEGAAAVFTMVTDDAALARASGEGAPDFVPRGGVPPYASAALRVESATAELPIRCGYLRGDVEALTAFANECFVDELARFASSEPVSFRIGMLGGEARLARCLSTAAALGGWEGGVPGSGQGIAAHAFRGSRIAVLAEAHYGDGGMPVVDRLVAAVDCGQVVNPDLVRQQIEGGLIMGLSAALAEQVRRADSTEGDIDALSHRIAQIRTWTFVSNRPGWLADPAHWQEKTREIEDRLSDALAFMQAAGVTSDTAHELEMVEFYTSHEALLLEYEEALARIDSTTGLPVAGSGHLIWIGDRTRQVRLEPSRSFALAPAHRPGRSQIAVSRNAWRHRAQPRAR